MLLHHLYKYALPISIVRVTLALWFGTEATLGYCLADARPELAFTLVHTPVNIEGARTFNAAVNSIMNTSRTYQVGSVDLESPKPVLCSES